MNFARRKLFRLQAAYQQVLDKNSPDVAAVMADLRHFCHADRSCWAEDPREHAMREGRREVWLRITHYLKLTDADIDRLTHIGSTEYED